MNLKILKDRYRRGITSLMLIVLRQVNNLKKKELLYVDLENIFYSNSKDFYNKYFDQPFKNYHKIIQEKIKNKDYDVIKFSHGKDLPFGYGTKNKKKILNNKKIINKFRKLFKKHIIFKNKVTGGIYKFVKKNIYNKKVLSVHIRGTDHFTSGHGSNQKHLMNYENFIEPVVKKKLKEKKCNKIFLATDEKEIYLKFKKSFGKKLIKHKTILSNTSRSLFDSNAYAPEKIKSNLVSNVIKDIIIMSNCKYSLCMHSGVSLINILLRNDYKYEFIDNHIDYER